MSTYNTYNDIQAYEALEKRRSSEPVRYKR